MICVKCKKEFKLDQDDISFCQRMKIPNFRVCDDCRFLMKAIWRNEITLYSGQKCDLCQKNIVTMYNPKLGYKIYCHDCYHSDKWDPKEYALDYDKNKTFFEQFKKLFEKVPKNTTFLSSADGPNINSEYANMAGGIKNCYLVFNGGVLEETMYCRGVRYAKEVVDIYFGENIERCYECVNVSKSNGVIWSKNSNNCINSSFLLNCSNLNNCFGCVNLRNKSYYFLNEQLSKEEYGKRVGEIMGSYSKMKEFRKKFNEFSFKFPKRENSNLKTINSTGDYLTNCKNINNSFEVIGAEDSKNLFSTRSAINSNGAIGFGYKAELLSECVAVGYSSNVIGSYSIANSRDIKYSVFLDNCQECIGCDSLKNSKYCILNKQYTKEEYKELKDLILKELNSSGLLGLMLPSEISPFAYNESIAQDNMPLTKEEVVNLGFRWEDDIQMTSGKETLIDIPDNIKDVVDSILNEILKCENCRRNLKITQQELSFYRKINLPIPHQCFYCRHRDRIERRGPYKFWNKKCDKCNKDIITNYNNGEIVYCEKCYQNEVI
ncbi:MAG: hypothetical protein U9R00_03115 [Patescibacteria group bacterium]|nr:hypothetical protein [Patescibacteria group bacterium]